MAFIAEHAVKRQQQTKRLISKEKNILREMIVTDLLRQYSEEHPVLPALNLLSIYEHLVGIICCSQHGQTLWRPKT